VTRCGRCSTAHSGTIEQAFSARRESFTKDGQIVYGGPDHYARLAAGKHAISWLRVGLMAKHPEKDENRMLTLDELRHLVEANTLNNEEVDVAA
jgi:hypothetical protein